MTFLPSSEQDSEAASSPVLIPTISRRISGSSFPAPRALFGTFTAIDVHGVLSVLLTILVIPIMKTEDERFKNMTILMTAFIACTFFTALYRKERALSIFNLLEAFAWMFCFAYMGALTLQISLTGVYVPIHMWYILVLIVIGIYRSTLGRQIHMYYLLCHYEIVLPDYVGIPNKV